MTELFAIALRILAALAVLAILGFLIRVTFVRSVNDRSYPGLRLLCFAIGLALVGGLAWHHDTAVHAGYRSMPKLPDPLFMVPESPKSEIELLSLPKEKRRYAVAAFATLPSDKSHVVAYDQKVIRPSSSLEVFETELFRVSMKPDHRDDKRLEVRDYSIVYKKAETGLNPKEVLCLESDYIGAPSGNPTYWRHSLSEEGFEEFRWLGWNYSLAGNPRPCRIHVTILPMQVGDPLKEVSVDELLSLSDSDSYERRLRSAASVVKEDQPRTRDRRSAIAMATSQIGLPFGLALLGGVMLAAALPRWRPAGLVAGVACAIGFLALLDARAIQHAIPILKDSGQPKEIRTQALYKGAGTFFWRKTFEEAVAELADDESEDQNFREFVLATTAMLSRDQK